MKKIKVAVNGCGRIGRAFIKLASKKPEIEIVAVNDLGDINNIAYLLKYDSAPAMETGTDRCYGMEQSKKL